MNVPKESSNGGNVEWDIVLVFEIVSEKFSEDNKSAEHHTGSFTYYWPVQEGGRFGKRGEIR